jgi:hypothetical protein
MKKILLSLIAVLALCLSTQAQQPIYAYQSLGTFTNIASQSTNISFVIDCRKQASVSLYWLSGSSAATAAYETNAIYIQKSLDGINYATIDDINPSGLNGKKVVLQMNGTTPVSVVTNLPTWGCGYMKIAMGSNAAASGTFTNMLGYAIKISSP